MHLYAVIMICTYDIISTDEDPGLRIEYFAVINLRGVVTNKMYYKTYFDMTISGIISSNAFCGSSLTVKFPSTGIT
jgi:hypothetical protein